MGAAAEQQQIEDLQRRLAEAEETLRAIRAGEIGGIVVDACDGPRVFTLEGADRVYRAMVEQMGEGAANVDADGIVLYCNPRLAEMVCKPRDRLVGATIFDHLGAGQASAFSEFLAAPEARRIDIQLRRADGEEIPASVAISSLQLDGTTTSRLLILTDLTQLKHMERLLVEAERLNALAQMATGLAHELNQPLAAATTYFNAARRLLRLDAHLRLADIESALDAGAAQILRAGRIIAHLREFVARGEPDKLVHSMHDLIRKSAELVVAGAEGKDVQLSLDLNADNEFVLADGVQIKQVLVNLMRNAQQAMLASASRRLVVSSSTTRNGEIRVDVADTGAGLSEAARASVFEPFRTMKTGGLGVGLSISRSIIAAHYGKIWAEPNPGGGAIFSFTLPLAEALAGGALAEEGKGARP
ncbi:nitrogen regulation protein NR(II) [Methylosinus sp. Sm6]|uniref:two-component system sensor histidine kinase NtrB n=1 Tax=Methylosinus sp. Sm6 TaxID=2866948 RepID=UPI001C99E743|nr:ATP-binding protein [Methylosinus sp. Sm6]MBY6240872.1 PAS domain S-box protein [Methylosinus sp. Sm6]